LAPTRFAWRPLKTGDSQSYFLNFSAQLLHNFFCVPFSV
jgi:hypothetical protein